MGVLYKWNIKKINVIFLVWHTTHTLSNIHECITHNIKHYLKKISLIWPALSQFIIITA